MREILFRGKLPSGAWVYGDLRQYPSGVKAIRSDEWGHMMEVVPDTVGQYTGTIDKNGTKIFEGDLVKAILPATDCRSGFEWPVRPVEYRNGVFGMSVIHNEIVPFYGYSSSITFEVIGNIHDNQELMEVYNAAD